MATQAPLDKAKPNRLNTLKRATHLAYHAAGLAFVWVEVWPILLLAAIHTKWWLLAYIPLLKAHGYRDELARNVADTWRHAIALNWAWHAVDTWQHPRLERLDLGTFTGWEGITNLIRSRGRAIPYNTLTIWVRRRPSHGDPKWLDTFTDYARRTYRYADAEAGPDPNDPGRDIIRLRRRAIPNRIEVEE